MNAILLALLMSAGVDLVEDDGPRIIRPFPNSPQEQLCCTPVKESALGGGRGRGGTYGLALRMIRHTPHPKFRGLILRRTVPELADLIDKCNDIYLSDKRVRFNLTEKRYYFPSGANIWLSALERHEDWRKYQGHGLCAIAWDELNNWEREDTYLVMFGSLRVPGRPPFMTPWVCSTFNPGGVGSGWVLKRFVSPAPAGTIIYGPEVAPEKRIPHLTGRIFFFGTFRDNPELTSDGQYEATLDTLPEQLRKQHKDGDFTRFEGQEFSEFDPMLHVIKPYPIPRGNDRKGRSTDYGMSGSATLWWIRDHDNNITVYDELYTVGINSEGHAEQIRKREQARGENIYGVLDSACFAEHGHVGPTIAQSFWDKGVRVFKSMKNRAMACEEWHRRLGRVRIEKRAGVEVKVPALRFFNTCAHVIETIPRMIGDGSGRDVKDGGDDHCYDSGSYMLLSEQMGPSGRERKPMDPDEYSEARARLAPPEGDDYRDEITGYTRG